MGPSSSVLPFGLSRHLPRKSRKGRPIGLLAIVGSIDDQFSCTKTRVRDVAAPSRHEKNNGLAADWFPAAAIAKVCHAAPAQLEAQGRNRAE